MVTGSKAAIALATTAQAFQASSFEPTNPIVNGLHGHAIHVRLWGAHSGGIRNVIIGSRLRTRPRSATGA